jgi:hypothetical protein
MQMHAVQRDLGWRQIRSKAAPNDIAWYAEPITSSAIAQSIGKMLRPITGSAQNVAQRPAMLESDLHFMPPRRVSNET